MIGVGNFKLSDKCRQYVNEVLESERISYGSFTQKFEKEFAAFHNCQFGIMSNSGTSSLMVSLAALKEKYGWKDGDEVIVPSVTFIATSNIVIQNKMTPVFLDVEPVFYGLDPKKLEEKITSKTKCIIPAHLFGCPADMDPILDYAQKYNLKVIEDSCETMFVEYKGRPVGSMGDIGCFSTYVAHILTTGVGGLSITNDLEIAVTLRSMINHGRDSIYINIDDDKGKTGEELNLIIERRFSFVRMGYSFRVTELEGAMGLAELEAREGMMAARWSNGQSLIQRLKSFEEHLQLPTVRPGCGHSFMMFPILMKSQSKRSVVGFLESRGVETRDMLPLINQPYYQKLFNLNEDDYPVAKKINQNGFYIASHHGLEDFELNYMVQCFEEYFAGTISRHKDNACLIILVKLEKANHAHLIQFYEAIDLDQFKDKYLIDDSADKYVAQFFQERGFFVLSGRQGKGHGIKEALERTKCEYIVTIGADGSDNPLDIGRILTKLRTGKDLVIASRFLPEGGRQTKRWLSHTSLGNRFFNFLISVFFNINITDSNNLLRGFRREAIQKVNLMNHGESVMFDMTVRSIKRHLRIGEISTIEQPSKHIRRRRNRLLSAVIFFFILVFCRFGYEKKANSPEER